MSATKVFWQDPYLTELDATVVAVNGDLITLNRTIFFAFSGGQESDSGAIAGLKVLEAKKEGAEIFYQLEPGHNLKPGDPVLIKIDWERRYRLMRLHFAAEIVLELINQNYGNPEKIGAHISANKARIDFRWTGSIADRFGFLKAELEKIVGADLEIVSDFSDQEKEIRYWEVKGFGKVACGGTHLKRTGEVGEVKLKRDNIGKGKERVEITIAVDPSSQFTGTDDVKLSSGVHG
ncbi:MAG: alanyl-tRNA editing protein [Desulfobacteraceae bacterium]|nr:MAG: alanyl-tRNA editing protein [Desulfobacteraceae bacterium]